MALKITSKKSTYASANRRETNKEQKSVKLQRRLEKRKAWRINKVAKSMPVKTAKEVSSTTRKLFYEWGIHLKK
jgi:hypothetical protein